MSAMLAVLAGLFVAVGAFLLLSHALMRMLMGVLVLGNGVNLLILAAGRLTRAVPPIVHDEAGASVANPLPQALILTAVVIGFAVFAFLLVLVWRAASAAGTDDVDIMRAAEPPAPPNLPLSY